MKSPFGRKRITSHLLFSSIPVNLIMVSPRWDTDKSWAPPNLTHTIKNSKWGPFHIIPHLNPTATRCVSMGNGQVSVGDHLMIKSKATQRLSNSSHDTCPRREVPVVSNLTWEIAHVLFVLLQVGNSMEKPIPFLDQIKHHMQ